MVYGVILAGGKGERFWPLSRADLPKQFLKLTSDKMMLEETIDRVLPIIPYENVRIVTGSSMSPIIIKNMTHLAEANIITEPRGRNTCAAIGLAAVHLINEDPDAVMVVLSADHLIKPPEKLQRIISSAIEIASKEDYLITIGIVPTRPETGYGYIKIGESFKGTEEHQFYLVEAFTEKPKAALAHEYYYSRNYLWNSGMFVWSARVILDGIKKHQPDMYEHFMEYKKHIGTSEQENAKQKLFENARSISIDFALLEHADNVLTVKGDILWDDIGGWNALARYKKRDNDNNVAEGTTVMVDSFETTVVNNSDGLVAALGVSDLVVVRSDNITLVVHNTKADRIKDILELLNDDEELKKYL